MIELLLPLQSVMPGGHRTVGEGRGGHCVRSYDFAGHTVAPREATSTSNTLTWQGRTSTTPRAGRSTRRPPRHRWSGAQTPSVGYGEAIRGGGPGSGDGRPHHRHRDRYVAAGGLRLRPTHRLVHPARPDPRPGRPSPMECLCLRSQQSHRPPRPLRPFL